ncbi:MAG TPA: class I SAM-dependent methyltransferase [Candidatus Limnocylindria bacterium]|nr:class I SAM-dependent methyltransferase [Candidatus Limnocylindria bacterium]
MADEQAGAALARLYDLDTAEEMADLDLYLGLAAATGGAVLELAAGSGRLALAMARAGHAVTAVDNDPHMLARAQAAWQAPDEAGRRGGSLETVEADVVQLELEHRFGLVILAFNTLLLLERDAQRACVATMARHLAPEGKAVLDVWLPSPEDLALYDGRLTLEWLRHDEETGDNVAKYFSARYDPALASAQLHTFYDVWSEPAGQLRRLARRDELSFLSSHEVLALVEAAGMAPEVVGEDYGLSPFGTGSERMVMVCGLL